MANKPTETDETQAEVTSAVSKLRPTVHASYAKLKEEYSKFNVIDGGLLFAVLDALLEAEAK